MNNITEVKDECSMCGELLQCQLCREGHGIGCERNNVSDMVKCQFEHSLKRNRE